MATSSYTDPAFTQLRAPAQDATAVADVLAAPEVGGFAVTSVLDRPEYEIRRAMGTFLAQRGRNDLVVVYLSCHGVQDARGHLYFAATDTVKDELASTGVESAWLLDRLEECRARRQVVILDCCFSGAFAHTKSGGDTDIELDRRLLGAGRGRVVLTASRASEYSYEGTPLPGAVTSRSMFTAALLDGLRTGAADRDGDGYVTVEDAYAYAADQLAAAGAAQSPQRWLYGGEGEIVLARNPRGVTFNPAKLPEWMQSGLDSPSPKIRKAAVAELGTWLTSDDPSKVLAAQQALKRIASNDSSEVAEARHLLQTTNPANAAKARTARRQTQLHTGERSGEQPLATPPQQRPAGGYQAPLPAGPGYGTAPRRGNKALALTASWIAAILGGFGALFFLLEVALSLGETAQSSPQDGLATTFFLTLGIGFAAMCMGGAIMLTRKPVGAYLAGGAAVVVSLAAIIDIPAFPNSGAFGFLAFIFLLAIGVLVLVLLPGTRQYLAYAAANRITPGGYSQRG